jgi:hypothetical protein
LHQGADAGAKEEKPAGPGRRPVVCVRPAQAARRPACGRRRHRGTAPHRRP